MTIQSAKEPAPLSQIEKAIRSLKIAIQDCEFALAILHNAEGHDKALSYMILAACEIELAKTKTNESFDTNAKSSQSSDEGGRGTDRGMVDGNI